MNRLLEANKLLRFLKESDDIVLRYQALGELASLRLGVYFDAGWAVRPNGDSQGAYIIYAIDEPAIDTGNPRPLLILDWASKRIPRVSPSSLSAEAQSGVIGVDALEFAKIFWLGIFWPSIPLREDNLVARLGRSPVTTDAKALYDAALSMSANQGMNAANKKGLH